MNLVKLFETQKILDDRIVKEKGLEGQDLLPEKILALQVELGELANEWRGFKFWSKNQDTSTEHNVICHACRGEGYYMMDEEIDDEESCGYCLGTGFQEDRNPLLEEYADCFHFILSIGNDLNIKGSWTSGDYTEESVTGTFNKLFETVGDINHAVENEDSDTLELIYEVAFDLLIGLGEKHLGFTTDQIEKAYYDKNKVNHQRQEDGY